MLSGDLVKVIDYWSWRERELVWLCLWRPESGESSDKVRLGRGGWDTRQGQQHAGAGSPPTSEGITHWHCPLVTSPHHHNEAWKTGSNKVLRGNESRPWWPISGPLDRPWMTLWWFRVSGALSLSVTLRAASLWRSSWRETVTATMMMTRSRQTLSNFIKSFLSEEGEKMLFINEC